jgi:hypothetical protein
MLPPVLEIYIVWHPQDRRGREIADEFVEHFRGTTFTGLIGGAVEVFVRSEGWQSSSDSPRPIPVPGESNGIIQQAEFIAIVPILGNELACAVENNSAWRTFIETMASSQEKYPDRVAVLPYRLDAKATDQTALAALVGKYQAIASNPPETLHDTHKGLRCRDLSQGLAQFLNGKPDARLVAFISHTKRSSAAEAGDVNALVALVRDVVSATRLREYFDASDLQPGTDWSKHLQENAATSALLALRTDLYPSREWCQKEVLTAKRAGMPIIILDGIGFAEERGSFLMDHVPRTPVRSDGANWRRQDVYRALNLLVDECLKRELWMRQQQLAQKFPKLAVSWWAPHAPEPVTLIKWLEIAKAAGTLPVGDAQLRILHPDPPLGPDEKAVLTELLDLTGLGAKLDVMTPRQLAARGG